MSLPRSVLGNSVFLVVLLVLGSACARARPGEEVAVSPQQPTECVRLEGRSSAVVPEVRPAALDSHIRFLADDSLQGRGTGTAGYDLAARYVAECFSRLGLKPSGTKGYMQPVGFRQARTVVGSSLVIDGPMGRRPLVLERDYVPLPDLLRPEVEVNASLVLVGFGVTAPDRGYDDYRTVDARGKIVVYLTGAPPSFPPTQRAHYATNRMKFQNAIRHGAVGVLSVRTRDQTFPWDRFVRQARAGILGWLDPRGEPGEVFPDLRGIARLSESGAEALFEGAPQSHADVLAAAEKGTPPAFDLPVRAMIRTVTVHERLESPNVAGLLPGSDPRLQDEVVVFTAHLDHLGVGEPVQGDSIYNGALDNASGTAALLEVARGFTTLSKRPRRSVLFLVVTAEERGLLGSDYFAGHPTVPIDKIVANVNLDGLAILYPLRQIVPMGAEHSTLDATVQRAANRMGIELGPDPFPEEVFFVRSDQYSFVRRGVPSLFLFMGLKSDSGVDAATIFREWGRTRYHTPQDDLTQPMDLEAGARHAQLNFLVGLEIANADERPAWKSGDFFGRMFGRPRAPDNAAGTAP
ncbi:MAG TPA: M28 family metallopeptidase [Gemmatimonadales bacterium]|nr:M28 family metallopeptidase [Gemmatimonadales bacterium]